MAQVLVAPHSDVLAHRNKQVAGYVVGEIEDAVILNGYQIVNGILTEYLGAVAVLEGDIAVFSFQGLGFLAPDFCQIYFLLLLLCVILHHQGTAAHEDGQEE